MSATYEQLFNYMLSLTAKDCSIMIAMEKLTNANSGLVGDNSIVLPGRNGVKYIASVSVTDLDPKCPKSMQDLERKWRDKDLMMVTAFEKQNSK